MTATNPRRWAACLALMGLLLSFAPAASACTVCFGGDPNDPMNKGAQAAIILLGLTVYFTLVGGVALFFVVRKRALRQAGGESHGGA